MLREIMCGTLVDAGLACTCYGSAEELLRSKDLARAGCVVSDICMPGMDGLALQRHLHAVYAGLPVILITAHGDITMAVQALKDGAYDFIEKPVLPEFLVARVRDALAYGAMRRRERQAVESLAERFARLTARELQVVAEVADGKSLKETARDLDVSPRTVEHHRANIVEKLGINGINEMIHLYARWQLLRPGFPQTATTLAGMGISH